MLHEWDSFYVIVGSSAAALTGLQFVVIALGAEASLRDESAVAAFGTPTIVHFCGVLTIAALVSVPGQTPYTLASLFALLGIAGVIYTIVTAHRAHRQQGYEPVFEDWLWHVGFPFAAYTVLLITGVCAFRHPAGALYFVAGIALALLFVGIHNAWDSAVYISMHRGD